ncbi:envelope biogenesis factor ElyC [Vibrio sp. SCSIO 43136]|uniref:envelope biogenesis factor ElyC n=1 Tax=Vibrio sp. SCSIO 43136 TaxID=2819101 RepID=UPI00207589F9|nr:envelope biogenesis factor ElyC [Vibrio sp. SCSIO 43136]USD66268.1 envelope biogenesis factor ElyC [Vibrio sp. SCSIO 43136]
MFELKKLIASILMPLPGFLLLGFLGLALVAFTSRRGIGCSFLLVSLVGIFVAAFQPVASKLLMPLERQYQGFLPASDNVDYVMVLGSGHIVDDAIPPTSELSRTGLMRLSEGIRILRLYPEAKLILSGYGGGTEVSNARMMAKVALALGVAKSDIILLETAKDTWEEARQAAVFVADKELVLVTSASHMQRALEEFKDAGLSPMPAPTNFLANDAVQQPWNKYRPQAQYLEWTEKYWHEQLGMWWQTLRDYISDTHTSANNDEPAAVTQVE